MNTKVHAVTNAYARPLSFFITAGQIRDYTGAVALLDELRKAQWMPADSGHDADTPINRLDEGPLQALPSPPSCRLEGDGCVLLCSSGCEPWRSYWR